MNSPITAGIIYITIACTSWEVATAGNTDWDDVTLPGCWQEADPVVAFCARLKEPLVMTTNADRLKGKITGCALNENDQSGGRKTFKVNIEQLSEVDFSGWRSSDPSRQFTPLPAPRQAAITSASTTLVLNLRVGGDGWYSSAKVLSHDTKRGFVNSPTFDAAVKGCTPGDICESYVAEKLKAFFNNHLYDFQIYLKKNKQTLLFKPPLRPYAKALLDKYCAIINEKAQPLSTKSSAAVDGIITKCSVQPSPNDDETQIKLVKLTLELTSFIDFRGGKKAEKIEIKSGENELTLTVVGPCDNNNIAGTVDVNLAEERFGFAKLPEIKNRKESGCKRTECEGSIAREIANAFAEGIGAMRAVQSQF